MEGAGAGEGGRGFGVGGDKINRRGANAGEKATRKKQGQTRK